MLKAMLDKTERALTFYLRRTRIVFPLMASVCCLWFLSAVKVASADEPAPPTVEFPAWSRTYAGNMGGRQVEIALTRVDRHVEGAYCFTPCARYRRGSIEVHGTIKGDQIRLSEIRQSVEGAQVQKVTWHARLHGSHMVGRRANSSMGAAQAFDLADTRPLPYETTVVADNRPENDDACGTPPHVRAIRLYRGRLLVQQLATDSQGACQVFVPEAVDANFDGWADITIALDMPASPNIPHQTWLFNPHTRWLSPGPKLLQEIASPEYDYEHKVIVSSWRDGCCSHGVTLYRWRGSMLFEDDTMQSYALPVLAEGGKRRYCYSGPSYIDGHIVFDDRVEERDVRLSITVADIGSCEEVYRIASDTRIDIWQRGRGSALRLARTEKVQRRPVLNDGQTRYCLEVPFFDHGRIVRVILDDDEMPHAPTTSRNHVQGPEIGRFFDSGRNANQLR